MPFLLGVRFVAELGMLACLAWGGWMLAPDGLLAPTLALTLPALALAVWSQWVAPRAAHRLADPARLRLETAIFTSALMTVALTQHRPAVLLGVLSWAAFLFSMSARGHEPAPPTARS